jgi:hypothetical protein
MQPIDKTDVNSASTFVPYVSLLHHTIPETGSVDNLDELGAALIRRMRAILFTGLAEVSIRIAAATFTQTTTQPVRGVIRRLFSGGARL